MEFVLRLERFPEWAIPMTKIVPVLYVDNGRDQNAVVWSYGLDYWWKKVDEDTYDLHVWLTASALLNLEFIPIYVDLDLVILNERVWHQVQSNKV